MNKKVWIFNHYAGGMMYAKGGRHYNFAKYLRHMGYEPTVFCCNQSHGDAEQFIETDKLWVEAQAEEIGVPFIFVRGRDYVTNGVKRVLNMLDFYFNAQKAAKEYAKLHGKPDVIYASSVHPLTLVAGIRLAKHYHVKCVSEVRDLWPESIVAYSDRLTKDNPLIKALYAGEKWIYKHSDAVIMTWPGGYDYICEKGWDREIPQEKVIHICNGVDLAVFKKNKEEFFYQDEDLDGDDFTFVYAGSIRKVNHLDTLLDAAKLIEDLPAKLLIFGDGDQRAALEKKLRDEEIHNVLFKGFVAKKYIPSVLAQCDVPILHNASTVLDKYGQSQNKFFEYLAAAKPILMTYSVGHSIVKQYGCGVELEQQTPEAIADAMRLFVTCDKARYAAQAQSSYEVAKEYDYAALTRRLADILG